MHCLRLSHSGFSKDKEEHTDFSSWLHQFGSTLIAFVLQITKHIQEQLQKKPTRANIPERKAPMIIMNRIMELQAIRSSSTFRAGLDMHHVLPASLRNGNPYSAICLQRASDY